MGGSGRRLDLDGGERPHALRRRRHRELALACLLAQERQPPRRHPVVLGRLLYGRSPVQILLDNPRLPFVGAVLPPRAGLRIARDFAHVADARITPDLLRNRLARYIESIHRMNLLVRGSSNVSSDINVRWGAGSASASGLCHHRFPINPLTLGISPRLRAVRHRWNEPMSVRSGRRRTEREGSDRLRWGSASGSSPSRKAGGPVSDLRLSA